MLARVLRPSRRADGGTERFAPPKHATGSPYVVPVPDHRLHAHVRNALQLDARRRCAGGCWFSPAWCWSRRSHLRRRPRSASQAVTRTRRAHAKNVLPANFTVTISLIVSFPHSCPALGPLCAAEMLMLRPFHFLRNFSRACCVVPGENLARSCNDDRNTETGWKAGNDEAWTCSQTSECPTDG